jgi:biopolymer transport protein ExbD
MMTNQKVYLPVVSLLLAGSVFAQEKKIERSELPAAVEKTVAEQSKGATIRALSKETENGQTTYEAEMLLNAHTKDVQIDANGTVIEIEEQVDWKALPSAVRAGLQAKAGKGKITKIESITKKEKLVAYEAHVMTDGKKSEVQVGPGGKPLDHEE